MTPLQQALEKQGADAHYIYIEEAGNAYAVLDLDEACDDLTNTNAISEPLYSLAKIQAALESVTPYCYLIKGTSEIYWSDEKKIAEAAARRIGGNCKAVALYTIT